MRSLFTKFAFNVQSTQGQMRENAGELTKPSSLFPSSHFRLSEAGVYLKIFRHSRRFEWWARGRAFMSDRETFVAIRNAAFSGQFREISLILMVLKKFVCFSRNRVRLVGTIRLTPAPTPQHSATRNFFLSSFSISSNTLSIKEKLVKGNIFGEHNSGVTVGLRN